MADAKVIPFDDDRPRGGGQRSGRRRGQSAGADRARSRDGRESRQGRESAESREGRGGRESDDGHDASDARDSLDAEAVSDTGGARAAEAAGGSRGARKARDARDVRDTRGSDESEEAAGAADADTTGTPGGAGGEVTTLPGQQARRAEPRAASGPAPSARGTRTPRTPRRTTRRNKRGDEGPDATGGPEATRSAGGTAAAGGTAGIPRPAPADASRGDSGHAPAGHAPAGGPASAGAPGAAEGARGERPGGGTDGGTGTGGGAGAGGEPGRWERRIASGLAFLRRRLTGDYEVDDFGYDPELTDQVLMSVLRLLYENYFRVEVKGIENIPSEGGALIVANHSGTLPLDGLMMQVAVHDRHPANRHLRLLAADLVFMLPLVNELARKAGHTLACAEDAELLLGRGELVGVMPEGFKGLGKPFSERYKLQRFGRGGFVSTALRTGAPIVPCSIVGAEEIYPMVGNAKTVARVLGFPYFPVTPTFPWLGPLGALPLPTKWTIEFGEPIETEGYAADAAEDPMLMFNLTDQVREQIQHTLYRLLVQRRSVFF